MHLCIQLNWKRTLKLHFSTSHWSKLTQLQLLLPAEELRLFSQMRQQHTLILFRFCGPLKKRSLTAAWSPAVTEKLFTLAIKIATWCHTCRQTIKTEGINSHRRGAIINTVRTDRRTHHVPLKHGKTRCTPPPGACAAMTARQWNTPRGRLRRQQMPCVHMCR